MPDDKYSEQKKTLADARRLLAKYGKCMVIRPTGFGKTWLLTELIKDYKNVLYLYPSAVVRDTVVNRYYDLPDDPDGPIDPETIDTYRAMSEIPGCMLMTYAKLIRLSSDDINSLGCKLIIFDEAHRMGGQMTKAACEKIFAVYSGKAHFIGATATPTRMDNFDVTSHFFADRMCYAYTLHNAIQAGLILKPHYCYATYDFKRDLEDTAKEAGEDLRDKLVQDTISAKAIELAKLYNMPKIIREVCEEYAESTEYMKFIVFFASVQHMNDKIPDVESWFREAYPDHEVRTLRISSATSEESKNTDKLDFLSRVPGRIDLIACIDMLNMGYHVSDQTGILMYRGTKSSTVFIQQMGRALSAGAGNSAIIFDIVDNLHRKAIYELYVKPVAGARKKRRTAAALDKYAWNRETNEIMFECPDGTEIPTQYHVTDKGTVVDSTGHASTFKIRDGQVVNMADPESPEKNVNQITRQCLEATGHEATYREILTKAMAEPLSHRCKYAFQIHFYSWCHAHNVPYPISDAELSELYGLDIKDFYEEFKRIVAANKIAYPLQDAQSLLAVGADGNTDPPLIICCEAAGVSIETLLDLIFQ